MQKRVTTSENQDVDETVNLLQELGLKEYEARCFLALTQLPASTAKEISDISEVPRTRVYDAIRALEAQGLVEVRHSSPKQFRAISIKEALQILRQRYDSRIDTLQSQLERLDFHEEADGADRNQEVWSLRDHESIESRIHNVVADAESEVVLLVTDRDLLTETLFDRLQEAIDRGVDIAVGGETDAIIGRLEAKPSSVQVFDPDFDWSMDPGTDGEIAIGRWLLVDRTTLLVSSFPPQDSNARSQEQAVFATGQDNALLVLGRRILSSGLRPRMERVS